ncbi:hypothetical protein P278_20410 [Zhouia amylolytica AD3]|uniref:Uncharacterized protein n=1 Tax=Zhouia amylolytica AD3 TaxID=1286632 RepID=W2UNH8_9FLAO|nr:hypothetical protein P278_20410 [Zhouia amylolytica AD3]
MKGLLICRSLCVVYDAAKIIIYKETQRMIKKGLLLIDDSGSI